MVREIPLTQSQVAIVDDEDYDRLAQHRWWLRRSGRERKALYAVRHRRMGKWNYETLTIHAELMGRNGVDHINGDGLDNRRCNLRLATQRQNSANVRPRTQNLGRPVTSQFKGVGFHKKGQKWRAYIGIDGKQSHLGLFQNEIDAALAYNAAAKIHYGEFARLNEIGD